MGKCSFKQGFGLRSLVRLSFLIFLWNNFYSTGHHCCGVHIFSSKGPHGFCSLRKEVLAHFNSGLLLDLISNYMD